MAEAPLRLEYEYFPDPTRGRPVSNGAVYVGGPNLDPTVLANRVDVVLIQQNGNRVIIQPAAQPFQTSAGGVIEYLGSPAIIRVIDTVSIAVHDAIGDQVYYNPLANQAGTVGGGGSAIATSGTPLNGSFEVTTLAGVADNWTSSPATNATITVVSTNQSHGANSLEFVSTGGAGAGISTSDRFDVASGGSSDIRFSLRSTSANVLNTVSLRYYDASNNILTTNVIFSDGTNNPPAFSDYLVTDMAPVGAVTAEFVLTGVSSSGAVVAGTTWFDNIRLDNNVGTYLIGAQGAVLQVIDDVNSVNQILMMSGATGVEPSIDQIGIDDLGLMIEQILLRNGIITGDLVGDVIGDVAGDLTGNADTVTTNADLTGDITSVGNVTSLTAIPNELVGSLSLKTTRENAVNNSLVLQNTTTVITDIGFLFIRIVSANTPEFAGISLEVLINGSWIEEVSVAADDSSNSEQATTLAISTGANYRIVENGGNPNSRYSIDRIID